MLTFCLASMGWMEGALGAGANRLVIRNESVEVVWNAAGEFTVSSRLGGGEFVRQGRFPELAGQARVVAERDAIFGAGQGIDVSCPSGNLYSIRVFPKLPFALFRATLANQTGEAKVVRNVRPVAFGVDLGGPASSLRALGTAGLTAPDKHPGSYVYLAVADPESRRGIVAGWITHDRGNGVVFSGITNGVVCLDAQVDYGRLRIGAGKSATTETFAIGYFGDARLGLESLADTMARVYQIRLRPQVTGYCTWYSNPNGGASDEKHLIELTEFAARELKPFGFDFVQIDDKWQMGKERNGPAKNFTTHNPAGPYPNGLRTVTARADSLGLVSGLWFMPFAGDHQDPYFAGHPDWFVKRTNSQPYETDWGGTSLDMTRAGARENLRLVVRNIRDWGFRYFKMDGLWTGSGTAQIYVCDGYREDNIGDAVFSNPDKTNIEAMRDGLKVVREAAGRDVFLSGCNLSQNMRSFSGSVGLVDSMRIGPDNGFGWPANPYGEVVGTLLAGPTHGSRKYFLHGRVWWNDPDPVYVRAEMPLEHARLITSWAAISGQFNLSTDWLPGLPAERLDILKRTMPAHGLLPRPVDLFENPIPRIWLLSDTRRPVRRDVIALYNWENKELALDYSMERIGLDPSKRYQAFDYWAKKAVPAIQGRLRIAVPPQSCRILAVRPESDHPQLLSTSRHVTQGIVDVTAENWKKHTLSGTSRLVANDGYELRVACPAGKGPWLVKSAEVSSEDKAAGVSISSATEDPGLIRVTLRAPVSREVHWSLRF